MQKFNADVLATGVLFGKVFMGMYYYRCLRL